MHPIFHFDMAKGKKSTTSARRQQRPGPGAITPIAGINLSRCGGNLSNPVRDIEWRAPQAQELNTTYRRKAAKIYTHGAVADLVPCERCAQGRGPFQKCVIAWDDKGYVGNANCANCYWSHKTSSCSRRYVLPCQALMEEGHPLGDFEEACRIHCHGAHIPDEDGEESSSDEEDDSDDEYEEETDEASEAGADGDYGTTCQKRKSVGSPYDSTGGDTPKAKKMR
ncbi:hypothetical protein TSTA_013420 [Talaromyces stipitatus ATCC 10500]|uniref:Uncharacterized protein n=1 Tax=Talaromyces stipitatus (strain ATCC 10500 / CBS 375.48 / QM 6759 / NRRL 1006) TaxID=441959 RepID=B8MGB9_TALSN|nr:uncharacterized protein TSTA_013420 [Talaromyces stipitatus ATCC 10500]EED16239.1 hypothetical protein TSTA_013420 [Talaromyces stipitatus ATCC 10500]